MNDFGLKRTSTDGLCPDCKRPVERLSEHNYFFKMGQYQDRLIDHIKTHQNFIRPESRRNEVLGFLADPEARRPLDFASQVQTLLGHRAAVRQGLCDLCLVRCPRELLSALEYKLGSTDRSIDTGQPHVHLVGKDILTTHAVYWSTMLMALNLPLPETIFAHGWWTVDGEKMSKSRGNVVDPICNGR